MKIIGKMPMSISRTTLIQAKHSRHIPWRKMNTQAEKKDPVDLVKAESKYGGYVTKENPVVSAQFAIKLAIQIDELNNQLAKFKENAGVYRTRIINAIHMLDAGHTKKSRCAFICPSYTTKP